MDNPDVARQLLLNGMYMGGHPAIDKPKQLFLQIDDAGVHVKGAFARNTLLSMPWAKVTALSAEGPDQVQTRFTATRFALMGPFALAFKKDKKSDCFVVVESVEGEFLFQVRKKSQQELRQPSHRGLGALKARRLPLLSRYRVGKRAITETSAFASSRS